jgi:hypothetical protein
VPDAVEPTAQAWRVAGMKQTLTRLPPGAVATCFQECPFQCTARPASAVVPTAHALSADFALTAARKSLPAWLWLGFGLGTRFHALPFQCRMTVLLEPVEPTAQALLAEVAATPSSLSAFDLEVAATPVKAPCPTVLGSGETFHAVPFQRKISGVSAPGLVVTPTAHAFVAEVAATPASVPSAGPGTGTRRAVVPFRRTRRCLGTPPCTSTPAWPTAHAPPRNVATPYKAPREGSAVLLTVFQAVPFQCARIGRSWPVEAAVDPTAHALLADRAATP